MKLILNQDNDMVFCVHRLELERAFSPYTGIFIGFNLIGLTNKNKELLGTFESYTECKNEIMRIKNSKNIYNEIKEA